MINSKVTPKEIKTNEIHFPILARHKEKFIVLFTESSVGTVVFPSATHHVGEFNTNWSFDDFPHEWEILKNEQVILSNG